MKKNKDNKCNKKTFSTEVEVLIIVQNNRQKKARGNENRNEIRYYYCRRCKGWHLTSKVKTYPSKKTKTIKKRKSLRN